MRKTITKNCFILIATAAIAGMICSCSVARPKCPYTLNGLYAAANLSDRNILVVFPDDGHIVINNRDDVIDDYGGVNAKPESRIRKFYFLEMFSTFKSLVSGDSIFLLEKSRPDLAWDSLGGRTVTLKTGSDSVPAAYSVPDRVRMQSAGLDSTVVIIIESIAYKRNNFHIEYYWDDKTRTPANLEVTAKVMVWDCRNDAPVFYGPVTEKTVFHLSLQRKHWDESAGDLGKKIIMAAKCL
jgi:hypothetical protein